MNNFFGNMMGMANQALGTMKQMGQVATEAETIMQIIKVYKGGGNPLALMAQMANSNPQMAQAMQMVDGKSPQQIKQMVQNMANEQGIDLKQLAQQYGLQLPN